MCLNCRTYSQYIRRLALKQGCKNDFLYGGGGGGGQHFKNVARAGRHSLNQALRKVLCASTIKFCAVTINVSTKHSVSTISVKLIKVYGRMTSCPNSVGRWILMAEFDRPLAKKNLKIF